MKTIVLTTDTKHHTFFVRELAKVHPLHSTVLETGTVEPGFSVKHDFEDRRESFEQEYLLKNEKVSIDKYSETFSFNNINSSKCLSYLKKVKPDVILVYGTRIIKKALIQICPEGIINLHGANPEKYRGLDSHAWAIYHNIFNDFDVTLHRINHKIDDGEIIGTEKIQIHKDLELHMLRSENVKLCTSLAVNALNEFGTSHAFSSIPQKRKGRYYSFMPTELKEICLKKYNAFRNEI
jgi:methionyl-tRNA formyltransferase